MIYILRKKGKYTMTDKVVKIKKEMKGIIKSRGISRVEKYNLLKKKAENLSKKERKILINECKRDYESFHRLRDLKDTIMIFVSALGMILSVGGILFEEKLLDYTQFSSIFLTITLYIGGAVLAITFIHVFSSDHIDISKQMIDILEEK